MPADFAPRRLIPVFVSFAFFYGAYRFFGMASQLDGIAVAGPVIVAVGCLACAGVCLGIGSAGFLSRPFGGFFGRLFYPEETLTQPPDDLLRALRQRLRDRYWDSAAQQIEALQKAYGPSPELFYLRAHLSAGQTGDYRTVNIAAVKALPSRGFDRYTALLRRDPPPRAEQTGIDA